MKKFEGLYPNWLVINKDNQKTFYTRNDIDESQSDYRFRYLTFLADGKYFLSGKWYCSEDESIRDDNVTIFPVIRSTEMRYIMAECYARQGNFGEAQRILSEIRTNRGCTEKIEITSWPDFQDELIQEARREWISEGQLFYLYKRLNAPVNFGKNVIRPLTRAEYLVPIPSNQTL